MTKRISLLLGISFAVLLVGSYLLVYDTVYRKTVTYSEAIAGVFSDDYRLSTDELEVWNGEKVFAHIVGRNFFEKEINTLILVKDSFGNKMMAGVGFSLFDIYKQVLPMFIIIALILAVVLLVIEATVYLVIKLKVSAPAWEISQAMHSYITDGKNPILSLM